MKLYVLCCGVCGELFDTVRKHTLTCSGACRVRAHRGDAHLAAVRAAAKTYDVHPSGILMAEAIGKLCPHLEPRIADGSLKIEDCQDEVHRAYLKAAGFTLS
jgi:hypothetical protein